MRETRTSGSVRGASGDGRPYREHLEPCYKQHTAVDGLLLSTMRRAARLHPAEFEWKDRIPADICPIQ